jgi:hypothetical protein
MCYTGLMDNNYIEKFNHPYNVRVSSEDLSVGHFTNIDVAVRHARDFSFYQGHSEFPLQNRLLLEIADSFSSIIFGQDYIDSRFMELSLLDATV